MSWDFLKLEEEIQKESSAIGSDKNLEGFRIKYLGRKGLIPEMFSSLAALPAQERPVVGKNINELRSKVQQILEDKKREMEGKAQKQLTISFDVTLPGAAVSSGHQHILTRTIGDICLIFERLGFSVYEGPEIEREFNNFTALNIPVDHPSRDAFDTFYLDQPDPQAAGRNLLLRSHTSPGQIRIMQKYPPPLAVVIPGRVYRPDAVDASHSFMFHQIEGLLVDQDIKFSDLKGLMTIFCKRLFGETIKMRFRPHFFPFTEPSAEVDISCYICQQKGCSVCARKGWLEIMGCGMVHPKVFQAVGYPKNKFTGLAFGLGVERITMLKYGINDIRLFFENDNRFLNQF